MKTFIACTKRFWRRCASVKPIALYLVLLSLSAAAEVPPGLIWSYPLGSTTMNPAGSHADPTSAAIHQCENYEEYYSRPAGYEYKLTSCAITKGPYISGDAWEANTTMSFDVFYQNSYLRSHTYNHHIVKAGGGCKEPAKYDSVTDTCYVECPADSPFNTSLRECEPAPNDCNKTPNPINILTGVKYKRQSDYVGVGHFPLRIERFYNSLGNKLRNSYGLQPDPKTVTFPPVTTVKFSEAKVTNWVSLRRYHPPIYSYVSDNPRPFVGNSERKWRNYYDRYLLASFRWSEIDPSEIPLIIKRFGPEGETEVYMYDSLSQRYKPNNNYSAYITRLPAGHELGLGWKVTTSSEQEFYSLNGKLLRISASSGAIQDLVYDSISGSKLVEVKSRLGGKLLFYYENPLDPYLPTRITSPEGYEFIYEYNVNGMIEKVIYPDDTPETIADNARKVYHYEDSRFPDALTGITDESGSRHATYAYDEMGRANLSELANGSEKAVVLYDDVNRVRTVINPLGKATRYYLGSENASKMIARVEGDPSENCAASARERTFFSDRTLQSKTDWQGNITTYVRDNYGREISRTEGVGTPAARTILTEYHPTLNLPVRIEEPGRVEIMTYDNEGRLLSKNIQSTTAPSP